MCVLNTVVITTKYSEILVITAKYTCSYAPWCPACRQFTSIWRSFADTNSGSHNIGMIDVTQNSGEYTILDILHSSPNFCSLKIS